MFLNIRVIKSGLIFLILAFFLFQPSNVLAKSRSAEIEVRLIVLPSLSMDFTTNEEIIRETFNNEEGYPTKEYVQNDILVTAHHSKESIMIRFTKTE